MGFCVQEWQVVLAAESNSSQELQLGTQSNSTNTTQNTLSSMRESLTNILMALFREPEHGAHIS